MNMMKRGLIALSVMAAVSGATGGLLASAASAHPTRGPEVVKSTQYEVGDGVSVGPWTGHGVVNTHGNITDAPSLATDPPNSNREMLVDPTGSFTVLVTGGTDGPFHLNPVTCAFRTSFIGFDAKIVVGTGAYVNAAGDFKGNGWVNGFLSRTATGTCDTNQNDPAAFSTTYVVAKGHINLHPKPAPAS
jgi:hypothetical protein